MQQKVWLFHIVLPSFYYSSDSYSPTCYYWVTTNEASYNVVLNKLMRESESIDMILRKIIHQNFYEWDFDTAKKLLEPMLDKIIRVYGNFIEINPSLRDKFDKEDIFGEDLENVGINIYNSIDKDDSPYYLGSQEWIDYIINAP